MLKCYLQTHVAESSEELDEVSRRYPDHIDEVDLFAELGLLGRRTILAHGVFADHQQRRGIAEQAPRSSTAPPPTCSARAA